MSRIFLLERRYWQRANDYRRNLGPGVVARWSLHGADAQESGLAGIGVPGTLPERAVFTELSRRHINFRYQSRIGDIPMTTEWENYTPDFFLPDYSIIIEVIGVYWHSREGAFEADYTRVMLLTAMGYSVYTLTDADILRDVAGTLDGIMPLRNPVITGNEQIIEGRMDTTASLRAQRQRWPRTFMIRPVARQRGVRFSGWRVAARRTRDFSSDLNRTAAFDYTQIDPAVRASWSNYGWNWVAYIEGLGAFFQSIEDELYRLFPDPWGQARRDAWRAYFRQQYADEWSMYNRNKGAAAILKQRLTEQRARGY